MFFWISCWILFWKEVVKPLGNFIEKIIWILSIRKVLSTLTYSTVTDCFRLDNTLITLNLHFFFGIVSLFSRNIQHIGFKNIHSLFYSISQCLLSYLSIYNFKTTIKVSDNCLMYGYTLKRQSISQIWFPMLCSRHENSILNYFYIFYFLTFLEWNC